jgi:hypothetical protein
MATESTPLSRERERERERENERDGGRTVARWRARDGGKEGEGEGRGRERDFRSEQPQERIRRCRATATATLDIFDIGPQRVTSRIAPSPLIVVHALFRCDDTFLRRPSQTGGRAVRRERVQRRSFAVVVPPSPHRVSWRLRTRCCGPATCLVKNHPRSRTRSHDSHWWQQRLLRQRWRGSSRCKRVRRLESFHTSTCISFSPSHSLTHLLSCPTLSFARDDSSFSLTLACLVSIRRSRRKKKEIIITRL